MEKHLHAQHGEHPRHHHYGRLWAMAGLSFIAMYGLMYAMVNSWGNVYSNLNQAYMAGLMTAPMVVFEVLLMGMMYPNKKTNAAIIGGSIVAGLLFFTAIQQQAGISDKQFLRSMIPHHSGAILMCKKSSIQDPEIKKLCEQIAASQAREIAQMKAILQRLDK